MRSGEKSSISILQFEHDGVAHQFREKAGKLTAEEIAARLPKGLVGAVNWPEDGAVKEFTISDEQARKVFSDGAYVYFPSSRAEIPHWLNNDALTGHIFDRSQRFTNRLPHSIFVERAIEQFSQWLASVIVDSRVDIGMAMHLANSAKSGGQFPLNVTTQSYLTGQALTLCNNVLKLIIEDNQAQFVWLGRHYVGKISIASRGRLLMPSIESLSAGQSTLLGIFGTILRYADSPKWNGGLQANDICGICIIDEIDAHIHVDLQYRVLPALIRMFPRVQFIVSSHSPLFVLGMEKEFGAGGVLIVEMPSGAPIDAEAYSEFGQALRVLQETKAFASVIEEAVQNPGKLLVLLEGETDPTYLRCAAEVLGYSALFDQVELAWVGAKDPRTGQGFHTGKDALNHIVTMARAKPELIHRELLLLYDNDARKEEVDSGKLHIRTAPSNPANSLVTAGIENFLPAEVISSDMYDCSEKRKPNGDSTTIKSLNKARLCAHVCTKQRNDVVFREFASVLKLIRSVVDLNGSAGSVPSP